MGGQISQQALNTFLAVLISAVLAEWLDTTFADKGSRDAFVLGATIGIGTGASVILEIGRQVLLRWAQRNGIDLSKILGTITVCFVLAIATGCASTKSIPTSSDASVTPAKTEAKGGTIACARGMHTVLDPATGNVVNNDCAENGAWTDPPTPEETNALAQFGNKLLEVAQIPLDVLAAVGRALGGAAGTPAKP